MFWSFNIHNDVIGPFRICKCSLRNGFLLYLLYLPFSAPPLTKIHLQPHMINKDSALMTLPLSIAGFFFSLIFLHSAPPFSIHMVSISSPYLIQYYVINFILSLICSLLPLPCFFFHFYETKYRGQVYKNKFEKYQNKGNIER